MFGNNSKKTETTSTSSVTSSSGAINSLVHGTKIEGNITADSDIRVDCSIVGDLNCKGKVIIGESGKISGTITCQNAIVEGSFEGTLKVADTLDIKESGKVQGDVQTQKLMIAPGALFNVNCDMGGTKVKSISGKSDSSAAGNA